MAVAPDLNRPTSLVFDLDPGEPAEILDCGRVALQLKDLFEAWNLHSFVKVSGSKGLHRAQTWQTEIGAYIQQNPTKRVFIAVGVGFVLSRRLWK